VQPWVPVAQSPYRKLPFLKRILSYVWIGVQVPFFFGLYHIVRGWCGSVMQRIYNCFLFGCFFASEGLVPTRLVFCVFGNWYLMKKVALSETRIGWGISKDIRIGIYRLDIVS